MEPLLAFVLIDGQPRQVCLGCSTILAERGFLQVRGVKPLPVVNAPPATYSAITYTIVSPFILADCQREIADRHVGRAWGT